MGVAILYPVFAQIILTFVLLLSMGRARQTALRSKDVDVSDIALDSSRWPEDARKFGNCYSNQFELPVIFYVLCLAALQTAKADFIMVALAWCFVISRIVHAYIHTGPNIVLRRGGVFGIGFIILAVMSLILLSRLLLAQL